MAKTKKKAKTTKRTARTAPRRAVGKAAKTSRPAARRTAARKKTTARKPAARKAAARKPATRRPAARNAAARKTAARKSAARTPAAGAASKAGASKGGASTAGASPARGATTRAKSPRAMTKTAVTKTAVTKNVTKGAAATTAEAAGRRAPTLDRERRTVREEDLLPSPPSSLDLDRSASSARTGRAEYAERLREHTSTGPALTGGDVDADWEDAESVGDEAPGGDNPTPDQDVVDEIGRALGIEYEDDEELQGGDEVAARDRHRWELDPASKDDFDEE